MMMLTFIFFFAFVVNIGMLVNAKINLQNAADLAAYAGAATQARLLNQISFLNYEMRRQYKKFLFRYYVLGNLAYKDAGPGGKSARTYDLDVKGGANRFGAPTACIIFNNMDNFCQMSTLPKISIPPQTALDGINDTLRTQLQAIEKIRQNNCGSIGSTNLQLVQLWLYNTNPNVADLANGISDPAQRKQMSTITGIGNGIGLLPREVLTKMRIDNLVAYVNAKPQKGVTSDKVTSMLNSVDPAMTERTAQAFLSAFNTLGDHTFEDTGSIVMDEILPGNSDAALLLKIKVIKVGFTVYAAVLDGPPPAGDGTSDCKIMAMPILVPALQVGVIKDPTVLTYYALRLKATAKVMFSPFGDMTLKAYAAAQPFGSRIGPPLDETGSQFKRQATNQRIFIGNGGTGGNVGGPGFLASHDTVPDLAYDAIMSPPSSGNSWDSYFFQGEMAKTLTLGGSSGKDIQPGQMEQAYKLAMVPNPSEGSFYNIPNDAVQDQFVKYFDSNHIYSFWAPVVPPAQQKDPSGDILSELQANFSPPTNTQFSPNAVTQANQLLASLTNDMAKYVEALKSGKGELGEGMNVAMLEDPFLGLGTPNPTNITISKEIYMSDPAAFRTSWNAVLWGDRQKEGRVGYSVKYIAFKNLMGKMLPANGQTTPTNAPDPDSEASTDIPNLKH